MSDLLVAAGQTHGPPHILVLGLLVIVGVAVLLYRVVSGRKRRGQGGPR